MRTRARADLGWGLGAQLLQYGAALALLPVLAARISSHDLGLWYVFVTIQSIVMLLELGFGTSLTRSFSYVFAGASRLQREGILIDSSRGSVDPELLNVTITTARIVYGGVAAVVAVTLAGPGTFYIASLGGLADSSLRAAWALYAIAIVLNIYFLWYQPLLLGSGRVQESYKATVIARGGFALLAALSLSVDSALWIVSASYLAAVLGMLTYARWHSATITRTLPRRSVPLAAVRAHFDILWHNAYRMGLVSLGAFFITKYSILLASSRYGLSTSAGFAVTLQVFAMIIAASLVPFNALLPRIATLRLAGDEAALKIMLASAFLLTWLVALAAIGLVLLFGRDLLALAHARTTLVAPALLWLIAVMSFLELNHSACAMVIMSANRVPFLTAALASGAAIFVLSTAAAMAGQPLWVLVAIQAVVQASYNNWKWPLDVYRSHRITAADFAASARLLARAGRVS